ncbi:MAG: response regulator [Desulfovibrio sp.]|nr:response regulator [Desulfovibrio sp.]
MAFEALDCDQSIMKDATELMPGGFFIYKADDQGTILHTNAALLDIFGCESQEEFLARVDGSFTGMIYPDDKARVLAEIADQIAHTDTKYDNVTYRIQRKDGQIRWIEDYGHFVQTKDYGDLYYVFIFDITEKKLTEEEIKRAEEALQSEKLLNQAKNTFIFNLSHDIRTPMNAIVGYIGMAMRHKENAKEVASSLERASSAANHLLILLDELLELAELDAQRVHPKLTEHTLADLVSNALHMVEPDFIAKGIHLSSDLSQGEENVLVDNVHLTRALLHILSNALKFTPSQGSVTVSVTKGAVSETGHARYRIHVRDTGIGMSPEFVKKAFDAFEREATSTQSGLIGTGIGLSVTHRILEMLGGSCEIESEKGKGSTITLSLPLKIAGEHQNKDIPKASQAIAKSGKGRILVVEDIEINRMLAETVLEESGFLVESVPDGCDAVDIVNEKPAGYYQAILMDIQMPIMNGYEATRAIRASERKDLTTIPIIALSANARPEDKAKSFASGMNAHVAKPFDVEGLLTTLQKYML